jgi:Polyketide cyclase / dehydrase and lipid transport
MMKFVIIGIVSLIALLALAVGVIALLGARLPEKHVASRSILLRQPPQEVYAVVRDFGSAPVWRSDVERVEVTSAGGPVRFREVGKNGTVNYELVEDVPAQVMVTRILDTDLGYSGQWTYTFTAENGGTRVTIREDGEVSNVLFRFMSRHVFGHTATIDAYLSSLSKRVG